MVSDASVMKKDVGKRKTMGPSMVPSLDLVFSQCALKSALKISLFGLDCFLPVS